MKLFYTSILILFIITTKAIAAPEVHGTIKKIHLKSNGTVQFSLVNIPPSSNCLTSYNISFEFNKSDTMGQEYLAMLMTADATGQSISIGYFGNGGSSYCSPYYIYKTN